MQNFFNWLTNKLDKPWLIIGKGPSFNKRQHINLNDYYTLGLNHVATVQHVIVNMVLDYDVIEESGINILNCDYLLMPWIPQNWHKLPPYHHKAYNDLQWFTQNDEIIGEANKRNKLLWFNLNRAKVKKENGGPIVQATHFSGDVAVHALSIGGVKTIKTIGLDGGRSYAPEFKMAALRRFRPNDTYNAQDKPIQKHITNYKIDFEKL